MHETTKTLSFVVAAAVLGLAAVGNSWINQPSSSPENELLGTPFYPKFTSTEAARSLEVSAVDPESGSLQRFIVENSGELWRIPTHYNYPAEAAARIAETSASVMGLERQALVGRSESEFEKFGVVDPLSEDIEDPESVGTRVTLKDANTETLVDYIIGDEIEVEPADAQREDFNQQAPKSDFYVRMADDSKTYRVSLDIDLSTRFSDWIDPDLLRISRNEVTFISIDNYKIEERGAGPFGRIKQLYKDQGDQMSMRRSTPASQWSIGNIHPKNEEVNVDRINEILGVLDQMKIVGVRPKFKYQGKQLLSAELELAKIPELESDPEKKSFAIQALQADLMEKGFNFGGTQEKLKLVSENGELEFGTTEGLRFRLHVGAAVSGDDETIEVGASTPEQVSVDAVEGKEPTPDSDSEDDSNRFLFVRVTFDETLLSDKPVEPKLPEMPVKPEGYVAKKEAEEASDSDADESADEKAKPETGDEPESEQIEPVDDRAPEFIAYDKAMEEYQIAKDEHEMNLTRFKQDTEAFQEKIEEGKELVKELNERFGDWFYVISASNLKTIQSTREDLVKFVEPAEGEATTPKKPDVSFPNLPSDASTFKKDMDKEIEAESETASELKTDAAKSVDSDKANSDAKSETAEKEIKEEPKETSESASKDDKSGSEKESESESSVESSDNKVTEKKAKTD